jgi:hypothetical protein
MVTSREYEGLTLEEATEKAKRRGFTVRIVEQDGKAFMLTMDFINNRINFRVRNGLILEAYAG